MKLKVATFNILNTSCRYEERKPLIQQAIQRISPDILGIQEVNQSQMEELFAFEGVSLHFAPLPEPLQFSKDPEFRIDGNSVMVNDELCEVVSSDTLLYESKKRVAQRLDVRISTKDVVFVNTHLTVGPQSERLAQVKQLLLWLDLPNDPQKNFIVMGDFNFNPDDEEYKEMAKYFRSAVKEYSGSEPLLTCPTGLYGPGADLDYFGCFDYIWLRGNLHVNRSRVLWDTGSGSLFASDHYPIYADLTIN